MHAALFHHYDLMRSHDVIGHMTIPASEMTYTVSGGALNSTQSNHMTIRLSLISYTSSIEIKPVSHFVFMASSLMS